MIQIPKFIKDTLKYFQYEGSPNPTTQDDLQAFMKSDHSILECLVDGLWQPETYYKENHIVRSPNMQAGFVAKVTKAGTSGSNEPDWGGATASDGTVEWKVQKQGSGGGGGASWEASTFYNVDSTVSLEGKSSFFLLCIKSGTSGATEPIVDGENSVTDGSITWKPIYYKKLPVLDSSNYVKGENLSGYWKVNELVQVGVIRYLQGDKYAGYYLKCTYAGTTGTVQPSPVTTSSTTDFLDGTAKWQLKQISDSKEIIDSSFGKHPSWYFDRGDGSDGVFNPSLATTISGVKNYTTVNIPSGVTVTVDKYALIKCQGSFINGGTITATGKGGSGGKGGIGNGAAGTSGAAGYSQGGAGGAGYAGGGIVVFDTAVSSEIANEMTLNYPLFYKGGGGGGGGANSSFTGNNGGAGGAGGGCIVVACNQFSNSGSIVSNGAGGGSGVGKGGGGGGGGGGCVIVIANNINSTGSITVNGGSGGGGDAVGASGSAGFKYTKELGVI